MYWNKHEDIWFHVKSLLLVFQRIFTRIIKNLLTKQTDKRLTSPGWFVFFLLPFDNAAFKCLTTYLLKLKATTFLSTVNTSSCPELLPSSLFANDWTALFKSQTIMFISPAGRRGSQADLPSSPCSRKDPHRIMLFGRSARDRLLPKGEVP